MHSSEPIQDNTNNTETTNPYDEIYSVMEDAASEHIKELNGLITEQKNSKTRVKRNHIQKKIDKKKNIIIQYMNELVKISGEEATKNDS